ncbi:unnamed protein product [Victoria cruziana]
MTIPDARKDLLVVNMGPHHPSMHGVLRLIVTLYGEDVIDCEPILVTMFIEAITVNAPEELGNIQLSRIASHLLWLGPFMADIGAQTPLFYIFRERQLLYDLFEVATGMQMMHNYFYIGRSLNTKSLLRTIPYFWNELKGQVLLGGGSHKLGFIRTMLRAFGIQWDLRKVDRYECYDEFDWQIGEMTESIKIIQQALEGISEGPYPSPNFELSKQELYVRVEAPKGELGIFLIGDNSVFPWRWKIRPPGFINLQILPQLVKRMKLADIMTILGSIDIIMGEVDR